MTAPQVGHTAEIHDRGERLANLLLHDADWASVASGVRALLHDEHRTSFTKNATWHLTAF